MPAFLFYGFAVVAHVILGLEPGIPLSPIETSRSFWSERSGVEESTESRKQMLRLENLRIFSSAWLKMTDPFDYAQGSCALHFTSAQHDMKQRFPCRSKNIQTHSAQICGRLICVNPREVNHQNLCENFFRELYFFDFFRIYIYHGEFLLRILLNRRVQCQKKSESQTTLCSQPSCRTRGYADHSSSECLE